MKRVLAKLFDSQRSLNRVEKVVVLEGGDHDPPPAMLDGYGGADGFVG